MNRHRFKGIMGKTCQANGTGVSECGLNYSATLHYNDDDHPYTPADVPEEERCFWVQQNVPAGGPVPYCLRDASDPVHGHLEPEVFSADDTVVMESPVRPESRGSFPGFEETVALPAPVMDAPAEDGGPGTDGATWSYEPATQDPAPIPASEEGLYGTPSVHVHEEDIPVGKEGSAARARWALENGDVVVDGPWPVRQYYWGSGDMGLAALELVEALTVSGEAFLFEVWWRDHETRMVRVQWGDLLLANLDLYPAVESWPT